MFDRISGYFSHGVNGAAPWHKQGGVKFVCPVPGYDRHVSICDYFNLQMLPVEMTETGPDMDAAEALIQSDPLVKGMWCVPVYSNPTGCVYSDETVRRIARLKPKAADFRLFWDNAYCVHNFNEDRPVIPDILRECAINGSADTPLVFASFSKVSFPGAAVSAVAASENNIKNILRQMSAQTIGPDKLSQLRHARFFKNADGVYAHMEKLAAIIKPKFDIVLSALETGLTGLARWSKPKGGYFSHFRSKDGCARRIVELCREAGLIITEAGAVYPYKHDPRDRDLRIAPTYPQAGELKNAMDIFCAAVKLSYVEKMESINNSTKIR
jgi:DNA-binding transcriptional MocR family regulator